MWIFTASISATATIYHKGQEDLEASSGSLHSQENIDLNDLQSKFKDETSDQLCDRDLISSYSL